MDGLINIQFSMRELQTIATTIHKYLSLHIESDYEAEEIAERIEKTTDAFEAALYD